MWNIGEKFPDTNRQVWCPGCGGDGYQWDSFYCDNPHLKGEVPDTAFCLEDSCRVREFVTPA